MTQTSVTALRVALVLQCAGAVAIAARHEATAGSGQLMGSLVVLGTALFVALGGERRIAYVAACWFFGEALLGTMVDSDPFSRLEIPAHSARFGIALALARPELAATILRITTAFTFAAHGLEAMFLKPMFLAYIQHAGLQVGWSIAPGSAAAMLRVIGTIDLGLAASLLMRPKPAGTLAYMGFWGLVTALCRTLYGGVNGVPDTLVRAANGLAPLALRSFIADSWPRRGPRPPTTGPTPRDPPR